MSVEDRPTQGKQIFKFIVIPYLIFAMIFSLFLLIYPNILVISMLLLMFFIYNFAVLFISFITKNGRMAFLSLILVVFLAIIVIFTVKIIIK